MRPQHNTSNKRGRNRNRHRGNAGGGNSNNRVLDSNGPDVKLRGTAQTIAEKYMQLGRDAQSSGDTVMAEAYYQHADHYYRLWLAAQPAGHPIQFNRRMSEDEIDDDGEDLEGDDEANGTDVEAAESNEVLSAHEASGESGEQPQAEGQQRPLRPRETRDQNQNRDGQNRNRNRWPRRFDRNQDRSEQSNGNAPYTDSQADGGERQERPEHSDRRDRIQSKDLTEPQGDSAEWEAPSFLRRQLPILDESEDSIVSAHAEERRARSRRPRMSEEEILSPPPVTSEE